MRIVATIVLDLYKNTYDDQQVTTFAYFACAHAARMVTETESCPDAADGVEQLEQIRL
jgi:hypothetical protein